jgi:hypothetical protein
MGGYVIELSPWYNRVEGTVGGRQLDILGALVQSGCMPYEQLPVDERRGRGGVETCQVVSWLWSPA